MWWKVASFLAPFVSAFLAAWLTYYFSKRKSRADVFLEARANALGHIYAEVTAIKLYSEKMVNAACGNEYGPQPEEEFIANNLFNSLWEKFQIHGIYLSISEQASVEDLMQELSMCKSMERAIISHNAENIDIQTPYEKVSDIAEKTSKTLYADFKSAYGI